VLPRNFQSFLPYCVCPNKEARNSFRRFRAKYPERYDYDKAQVSLLIFKIF